LDQTIRDLIRQGDRLFAGRSGLISAWQAIAENFYPMRADFNGFLSDDNSSSSLFSSYPVLAHRELGNMFAAMLRPRAARWFSLHVGDKRRDEDREARAYLEYLGDVMWRAMYDPEAGFVRATKEADHDFAAFGQAVIEPVYDPSGTVLFYRTHHLRDTAWSENARGKVDVVHRKWVPTARQLQAYFPGKLSRDVESALRTDPEQKFECRHIVVPSDIYRGGQAKGRKLGFTSIYVECQSETVLEERPRRTLGYVIPRWQTVSGSQYARSPATEIALPDSRTLQIVVRTLREAGEKHVDPPMLARQEAIRSDIALYAGGVTFYDDDDGTGTLDPIRPIDSNPGTMPIGQDIANALRDDIRNGLFLDKLMLPQADMRQMTATEVRRRIEEYVRAAAPLFEPIEEEYSAPLCNEVFEQLQALGTFGPPDNMPESLRGEDIQFTFQSPLRDLSESNKTSVFVQGLGIVGQAAQFDPAAAATVDVVEGLKDALKGLGFSAKWMKPDEAVDAARAQMDQKQNIQSGLEALNAGADIGTRAGNALNSLSQAGVL